MTTMPPPPVEPGELDLREPASWPKVVGTISVVWGSLTLCCSVCGIGYLAALPMLLAQGEQHFGEPFPDVMRPGIVQMALMAIGIVGPPILLAAGITLLRRKAIARPLHLLYAVFTVLLSSVVTVIGIQQHLAIMEWARNNPSSKWAQQANSATGLVMSAVIFLIFAAWPLFCMIWFGALKRNPAEWVYEAEEPAA